MELLLQVILFYQFDLAYVHLTPQESTVCVADCNCGCNLLHIIDITFDDVDYGRVYKCSYRQSKVETYYDNHSCGELLFLPLALL